MNLEKFQFLHRLTGFIVILFLLLFAVTGLLLNHAGEFNLDKKYLDSDWLLQLYGIGPPQPPIAYAADGAWLTLIESRLYFNDRELPERAEALLGLVRLDGTYIAALPDAVLLLTADGDIIEKITRANGLPAGPQKLGKLNEELFIIATAGGNYSNTMELGDWRPAPAGSVEWSAQGQLPESSRQRLLAQYRGSGLSVERALLDLHSGRLLGRGRIIIVDIAAVLLILSALSGVSMWYKKKKMLAALNKQN